MRVLVTGSEGFVGYNVSSYLEKEGYKIVRTTRKARGLTTIAGDITDYSFILDTFRNDNIEGIVHCAGISAPRLAYENPDAAALVNGGGTNNMLRFARQFGVKRFVLISSSNVYGYPHIEVPVKETTHFSPRSAYDHSKILAEDYVRLYAAPSSAKPIPSTILRSWKVFGRNDMQTAAIPTFIKKTLKNEAITLNKNGIDTSDFYHVTNLCFAVELALTKDKAIGSVYNVGSGVERSVREVAEEIKRITNSDSKLNLAPPRPEDSPEQAKSFPVTSKIQTELGYKPIVSFEEGIIDTIEWVKSLQA